MVVHANDHPYMKSEFGWIEIDQVRYEHDVIIHRDGTVTKRSKKKSKEMKSTYGHTPLSDQELEVLKKEKPEIVYIGTGQYGDLPITPEAERELSRFEKFIRPTPEILDMLKKEHRSFIAIIHVTC
ncbi:MAG TPA: MTH938/NDUFAF3 family protein [Methanoregula sp.]|nr:MTH938/NDUFAF3 family protein [Methanoregula sp.]